MEILNSENQCYFMGKYFATFEELIKYESDWQISPLDQESAEMLVKTLGKEIVMNAFLTCKPMTNIEFKKKLNEIFDYSINVMRKVPHD